MPKGRGTDATDRARGSATLNGMFDKPGHGPAGCLPGSSRAPRCPAWRTHPIPVLMRLKCVLGGRQGSPCPAYASARRSTCAIGAAADAGGKPG